MRIGYDGRSYSDDEYCLILEAAIVIIKRLRNGIPLNACNFSYINEYAVLSRKSRLECLTVLCKRHGAIKMLCRNEKKSWTMSFYAANKSDLKNIAKNYEFVSFVDVKSTYEKMVDALSDGKELNITGMSSVVWAFKELEATERMIFIRQLESSGLIKTRTERKRRMESIIMSLPCGEITKKGLYVSEEMKAKTKSEELIEQANKLLAAAEEAKKEEEKQLSKHEIMNIQREINVEIIEMEKQIDGMIDSFSKLKSLFDKLKQS